MTIMKNRKLQIEQLDKKFKVFATTSKVVIPPIGWTKAIRLSLGMTMQQLASRLKISKQSVMDIERREQEGSITLKNLRQTADALDMDLVYGFVPRDGSLDKLIERKAKELAHKIITRTSNTMKLEDQENSRERLEKAIEERSFIIKHEMPKILWD